jgi:hypothetical protein
MRIYRKLVDHVRGQSLSQTRIVSVVAEALCFNGLVSLMDPVRAAEISCFNAVEVDGQLGPILDSLPLSVPTRAKPFFWLAIYISWPGQIKLASHSSAQFQKRVMCEQHWPAITLVFPRLFAFR